MHSWRPKEDMGCPVLFLSTLVHETWSPNKAEPAGGQRARRSSCLRSSRCWSYQCLRPCAALFLFSFFTWGMGIHTRVLGFVQQAPFRTKKSPQPPLCLYCFFLSSPTDAAEQTLRICLLVLFRTSEGTFSKFLLFIHC